LPASKVQSTIEIPMHKIDNYQHVLWIICTNWILFIIINDREDRETVGENNFM